MATKTQDLKYRIGADFGEVRREAEKTGDATKKFQRELDALERKQREHRRSLEDLGKGMAAFGVAVATGLGLAAKAAIDWESAFTGVRKTVDGSDEEIAALEGELRNLARTLPATHKEIAAVAEAAGQLGIKRDDIAEFTKVMVDLGETTNLTAEEAATALAKFSNIMGVAASDVDRLGSTLVALGNDGASTEKDIIDMGLRIAGAGHQIGLSSDQVLGFASALSSVGIEAEAGGTAISTVMVKISTAVANGGEELDGFAKVAGITAQEFRKSFQQDAGAAIILFVQGLAKLQAQGENVFGVLESLSLEDARVRDTLLRAAGASDLFTKSLQVGSRGWAENIALTEEANKRYETSASKIQVVGNQIKDALIDVGATVLPVVAGIAQGISDVVRWFQSLPGPVKEVVTWVGLAAGVLGSLGGAALIVAPKITNFRDKMSALADSGGFAGKALGKFGMFLTGPWGFAIGAGVTLLGLFAASSGAAQRKQAELAEAGKSVAKAIAEQNGVIDDSVRKTAAKAASDSGLLDAAKAFGIELPLVTDAILGQGNAYDAVRGKLQALIDADNKYNSAGQYVGYSDRALDAIKFRDALGSVVDGKNKELEAEKNVKTATEKGTAARKELKDITAQTAEEAEQAADAFNDMVKALDALNGITLTYRAAQREYLDQIEETTKALADNGTTLDINTAKGRANLAALDAQAKAANSLAEAAGREAESMGGAAAGAATLTASLQASRPELVNTAMQFGMTKAEAEKYADSVLAIPSSAKTLITTPGSAQAQAELKLVRDQVNNVPPKKDVNVGVISAAARAELEAIKGIQVTTNSNGTVTVRAETKAAQDALNALANRPPINLSVQVTPYFNEAKYRKELREIAAMTARGQAYGGIVQFAQGGMYENHAPQIVKATPGMMRVWAEPETDRESYIPWAMDRRSRATNILRATADAFGYSLVPRGRSMASMQAYGGGTRGSASVINLNVGVIGSQSQLLDWLVRAQDTLRRQQRA